jgi:hypothetical protein
LDLAVCYVQHLSVVLTRRADLFSDPIFQDDIEVLNMYHGEKMMRFTQAIVWRDLVAP